MRVRVHRLLLGLTLFFQVQNAWAYVYTLPENLTHDVLSESTPTAFAVNDFSVEDFHIEWQGPALSDLQFNLVKGSLEWVRVADLLVLPRARVSVTADKVEGGSITSGDFTQHLILQAQQGNAEMPVALISGDKNPIRITLRRGGTEVKGTLIVRFSPHQGLSNARIFADSSCSPYNVRAQSVARRKDEWIYIGCRVVRMADPENTRPSLELLVYWDNVGQSVDIGGVQVSSASNSVWALRVRSKPGTIGMKAGEHKLTIHYNLPPELHRVSLGLGVGPYSYSFQTSVDSVQSFVPLVTVYGSFFVTESMRLVAFDATAINSKYFTDLGLYLNTESIKTVDGRLSVNLMLGAHAINFQAFSQNQLKFGAPQGLELVFRDAPFRRVNFSTGAFVYPEINGKSYYNVWFRWGSTAFFAELNFIAWKEMVESQTVYSRSLGVTVGAPLLSLF